LVSSSNDSPFSKREELISYLNKNNIQTLIHYPIPPHKQNAYKNFKKLHLPITEKIHNEVLSLPIYSTLTLDNVEYIIQCLNSF